MPVRKIDTLKRIVWYGPMALKSNISKYRCYFLKMSRKGYKKFIRTNVNRFKKGEEVEIISLKGGLRNLKDAHTLLYLYGNNVYEASRPYSKEELKLLIMDIDDKERRKFERLKQKFSLAEEETKKRRERIPEQVRIAVWRRDEGKCVECGSKENLEYDHIIPVSKGGSSTARNIQLLCERCNREKSDKII